MVRGTMALADWFYFRFTSSKPSEVSTLAGICLRFSSKLRCHSRKWPHFLLSLQILTPPHTSSYLWPHLSLLRENSIRGKLLSFLHQQIFKLLYMCTPKLLLPVRQVVLPPPRKDLAPHNLFKNFILTATCFSDMVLLFLSTFLPSGFFWTYFPSCVLRIPSTVPNFPFNFLVASLWIPSQALCSMGRPHSIHLPQGFSSVWKLKL